MNELSTFNISYNPLISGVIPVTGQLSTFEKASFLGNPLQQFPTSFNRSGNNTSSKEPDNGRKGEEEDDEDTIDMSVFYWSTSSTYVAALIGIAALMYFDCSLHRAWFRLVNALIASAKSMLS